MNGVGAAAAARLPLLELGTPAQRLTTALPAARKHLAFVAGTRGR